MENIVCAGFPSIVQRFLELLPEELDRLLVGDVWHESLPQILDVLETRNFWQAGVHHHQEQRYEEVAVLTKDLVRVDAQGAKSIEQKPMRY